MPPLRQIIWIELESSKWCRKIVFIYFNFFKRYEAAQFEFRYCVNKNHPKICIYVCKCLFNSFNVYTFYVHNKWCSAVYPVHNVNLTRNEISIYKPLWKYELFVCTVNKIPPPHTAECNTKTKSHNYPFSGPSGPRPFTLWH